MRNGDANAAVGEDTITFDAAVSGIIDLDASPLMITDDVGIQGWDQARGAGLVPRQIHGARLVFQSLSFGDGARLSF